MSKLRYFAVVLWVVFTFLSGASHSMAQAPTEEGRFKAFYSDGWFGTYALREFEKIAPPPGVNWFVDYAQDWLPRAQRDGWLVKNKPSEALNGAILVGYDEGLVWVGVARDVTDKGLVFETVMGGEGKPARYAMNFDEVMRLIHFKGCILPERLPGAKIESPMMGYKSVVGTGGSAWPVKEFDKVAPSPGFNWKGPEKDWAEEAERKGWAVERKPVKFKPGSLLLFAHAETGRIKVASVREDIGNVLVFEYVDPPHARVITSRLAVEQLADKTSFGGYVFSALILPEKKKR